MKSILWIRSIILIGLLLGFYPAPGQDIPEINKKDIAGLIIKRNDSFDGESLWGYMNGGADIYLEYGFDILRVQEFESEGETIKLELFKMENPVSAFGIYSIKTFKCRESNVLTNLDCLNDYQYQLLYGEYYIQIINESGSDKAKKYMAQIATALIKKLEKTELTLPIKFLTDSLDFSLTDIIMIKGELGILNKASVLTDLMQDIENYLVFYARRKLDGNMHLYYEIIFDKKDKMDAFKKKISHDGLKIISKQDLNVLCILKK